VPLLYVAHMAVGSVLLTIAWRVVAHAPANRASYRISLAT